LCAFISDVTFATLCRYHAKCGTYRPFWELPYVRFCSGVRDGFSVR